MASPKSPSSINSESQEVTNDTDNDSHKPLKLGKQRKVGLDSDGKISPSEEDCSTSELEKCLEDDSFQVLGQKRKAEPDSDNQISDASLPKELKAMFGALKCELCSVTSTSPISSLSHYKGKSHWRKVSNYLKEHGLVSLTKRIKTEEISDTSTSCKICNVLFTSNIQRQQHFSGKKHRKRIFSGNVAIEPLPAPVNDNTGRFGIGSGFLKPEDENQKEVSQSPASAETYCSLCRISASSPEHLRNHLNGAKHKKRLAAEVAEKAILYKESDK